MTDSDTPDLMDPEVQQCPYDFYKALRASAPLYQMPSTGFHLVSSYQLAREVIRAPDQYLSSVSPMALADDGVPQEILEIYEANGWVPLASCSTSDPPQHTRVRGFLEKLFTAERVRAVTPTIDAIAESLLDELAGKLASRVHSRLCSPTADDGHRRSSGCATLRYRTIQNLV